MKTDISVSQKRPVESSVPEVLSAVLQALEEPLGCAIKAYTFYYLGIKYGLLHAKELSISLNVPDQGDNTDERLQHLQTWTAH